MTTRITIIGLIAITTFASSCESEAERQRRIARVEQQRIELEEKKKQEE